MKQQTFTVEVRVYIYIHIYMHTYMHIWWMLKQKYIWLFLKRYGSLKVSWEINKISSYLRILHPKETHYRYWVYFSALLIHLRNFKEICLNWIQRLQNNFESYMFANYVKSIDSVYCYKLKFESCNATETSKGFEIK